jgi:hypothetical protein
MQMLRSLLISVIGLALLVNQGWAMDQRELTIKAAYLFRLSLFVEWPAARLSLTRSEPIFFCVAGDQSIAQALATVLADKSINAHKILVRSVHQRDDLSVCHLLYLPKDVQSPKHYLTAAAPYPVLTIGETDVFYQQGGMILLFTKDNTIHFAINEQAGKKVGLDFRAQLLNLANPQP